MCYGLPRVNILGRLLLLSFPAPLFSLCLNPLPLSTATPLFDRCHTSATTFLPPLAPAHCSGRSLSRAPIIFMLARRLKGGGGDALADIEDCVPASLSPFPSSKAMEFSTALLSWYDENKRDLPWRRAVGTPTHAYAVWVSEIMLQQTRVATVIDYWERWMKKWPTVESLASASLEEVNEMWSGLGYYRRAKMLHEGAQFLVKEHGGSLPSTVEGLKTIPGVGDYTAGAVASIAFNVQAPLVDGNVIRVISRLEAFPGDPKVGESVKGFWKVAGSMVPPQRPGDFNQGLMELGATLCTPTSPGCDQCPVRIHCSAHAQASKDPSMPVTRFPTKAEKAPPRDQTVAVCLLIEGGDAEMGGEGGAGGNFALFQRPAGGLLGGLWEFPSVAVTQNATLEECEEALQKYLSDVASTQGEGGDPAVKRKRGEQEAISKGRLKHVGDTTFLFSHIKQLMRVHVLRVESRTEVRIEESGQNGEGVGQDGTDVIVVEDDAKQPKSGGKRKKSAGGDEPVVVIPSNIKWVREEDLEAAALPTVMRKALAVMTGGGKGIKALGGGGGKKGVAKAKEGEKAGSVDAKGRKQTGIGQFFGGGPGNK